MKYLVILLFVIAFASSLDVDVRNDTEAIPNEPEFAGIDYHFLLRLIYTISEEKVPAHLVNVIYTAPEENNITSADIVNLFNLQNLTIQKIQEVLHLLNIPISSFISINGLDNLLTELNWPFTMFYNSIISQIDAAGNPVRNALEALQIDSAQFSLGIAFGDPDPYTEFKKGNFTYQNLENATSQLGITVENLFSIVNNNSLIKLKEREEEDVVEIFQKNGINQNQALAIWHNMSITMENVYNVENLRNYLTNINNQLNAQTTLGVAFNNQTVAINREIFNIWRNRSQLITINATAYSTNLQVALDETSPIQGEHTNIVTLQANNNTLYSLPLGQSNQNFLNCTLVTIANNNLVLVNVNVTNDGETLTLPRNTTNNLILGTPLVCNNQIFGILKKTNTEDIVFDSFAGYLNRPTSHGSKLLPVFTIFASIFLHILVVSAKMYFS